MKNNKLIILLFIAICCFISLPAIHQIASPASIAIIGGGAPTEEGSSYYSPGASCVLYHAYWDQTADDHSPLGTNDGTVSGATFGASGLTFNGTSDRVVVTHNSSLNFSALSIFIWMKFVTGSGSGSYPMVVSKGYDTTFSLHFVDNTRVTRMTASGGALAGSTALSYDTSYFLCLNIPGTEAGIKSYINNVVEIDTAAITAPGTNTTDLWIGGNPAGNYYFPGIIHEVLLFNATQDATSRTNYFDATKTRYGY